MKKILLSVALISASLFTFAQSAKLGIRGGLNLASLSASSKSFDASGSTGNLVAFNAGFFADLKVGKLSVQPGIYYSGKGGKEADGLNSSTTVKLHYIEVPVTLVYHAPVIIGDIYLGAGPYAAMGFAASGRVLSEGTDTKEDLKFGDGPDNVKRADYGVQFIGGLQLKKGIAIHFNYDLGLTNILPEAATGGGDFKIKNGVFGIGLGYSF
ncbi:PorT family protein [Mucilaginibacter terrenus]|uniref:PorT family protein n=1 Tax=Mucilaginibacter terrenus TaxID=2482727 RepID=A0A3E2NX21_9SPHI|nr:porin family protein [Mucilaginibacter terrenus]RFZ85542.1 PorT family protein [Mucilaginibacter terrenus]